jgi:hypothetical protein
MRYILVYTSLILYYITYTYHQLLLTVNSTRWRAINHTSLRRLSIVAHYPLSHIIHYRTLSCIHLALTYVQLNINHAYLHVYTLQCEHSQPEIVVGNTRGTMRTRMSHQSTSESIDSCQTLTIRESVFGYGGKVVWNWHQTTSYIVITYMEVF